MSRSAQAGYIAFGPQEAKGTLSTGQAFYKYRATDIDFGAVEPGGILPPEIASIITPTGAYKMGVFAAGGFTFIPRLSDDIGWLLHGMMGNMSSAEKTTGSGVYAHTAKFPTDPTQPKWFNVKKYIPGSSAMGENVLDCVIARVQFTLPQAGPVSARLDMVGRSPTFEEAPSWTISTLDDGDSFPVTGTPNSYIKLPSFNAAAQKATGAVIEMTSMTTTPQQEFVIGSYYPDDFVILQRAMTIRWVYKWEDPALCRTILTGAATGATAWTPQVYTSNFEAQCEGSNPTVIGGTGDEQAYRLKFTAGKVNWSPNGPIRLMGNNILAQEYIGTVLEPAAGEYATFVLENAKTAYAWPT